MTSHVWHPAEIVEALAYDTPMVGWRGRRVNTLRLWSARAADPLRLDTFNRGDHVGALAERVRAEAITQGALPERRDARPGRSCGCGRSISSPPPRCRIWCAGTSGPSSDLGTLPDKAAIQLNDTHPAIAIPELMRILIDLHQHTLGRGVARSPRATFCYTNHTLLPEALERWPVPVMEQLLPRHMQIIYLINARHLARVRAAHPRRSPSAVQRVADRRAPRPRGAHGPSRLPRIARVNGVSALHTGLMRQTVFSDLHALFPDRIVNKTNGITFRRWLHEANPGLTDAAGRGGRRRACWMTRRRWRRCGRSPTMPRSSKRFATVAPRQQGGFGRADPRAARHRRRPRRAVRRADQAHPRVQAPAAQHPGDDRALRRDPRRPDAATGRRA